MKKLRLVFLLIICVCLSGCSSKITLPKLSQERLEELYQQEIDKNSDKAQVDLRFDFMSLSYNGNIYTADRRSNIASVYGEDVPCSVGVTSINELPLEKIGDVYGEAYIKPVYGDYNADGHIYDVYAWYDDKSKVNGVLKVGMLYKFNGYDTSDMVALAVPRGGDYYGNDWYEIIVFYHLNDVTIEKGKDLLDIILDPMKAEAYLKVGDYESNRQLSGGTPEEVFFLGDLYKGTAVDESEVKDLNEYSVIHISEKESYRLISFRDYGDGIIGYATPEGTNVYIRMKSK